MLHNKSIKCYYGSPCIFEVVHTNFNRGFLCSSLKNDTSRKNQKEAPSAGFFFYSPLSAATLSTTVDWMSGRDHYLDIEPQICIKALTGPIITDSGIRCCALLAIFLTPQTQLDLQSYLPIFANPFSPIFFSSTISHDVE